MTAEDDGQADGVRKYPRIDRPVVEANVSRAPAPAPGSYATSIASDPPGPPPEEPATVVPKVVGRVPESHEARVAIDHSCPS